MTIASRDEARLAQAIKSLETSLAQSVQLDATDPSTFKDCLSRVGSFDHLVLAHGSSKGIGPFPSLDVENFKSGFEEKTFSHFALAQAALPHLAKDGSMTFITAPTAKRPGTAGIGAANAAINALVPVLARELKPLRVNAIAPGMIDTPWWNIMPEQARAKAFKDSAEQSPVGRIGSPEDIAEVVCFLIGNGFMDGQTLTCDGGLGLTI